MILCDNCDKEFIPERTRWLCPRCGYKMSCCEGEPLEEEPLCPYCKAPVRWVRDKQGNPLALDPEATPRGIFIIEKYGVAVESQPLADVSPTRPGYHPHLCPPPAEDVTPGGDT